MPAAERGRRAHDRATGPPLPWLTDGRAIGAAWVLWAAFALGVTLLVAWRPDYRTVTPVYRRAAADWWAGRDLYQQGQHGFLYLPQGAILYTPFTWPPHRLGEVLWRWAGLALYASAIWRLARLAGLRGGDTLFPLVTLLSIPAALGGARNGQANLPLAGLMVHAGVDLAGARWRRATLSLALALGLKPLGLIPLLLAGALYRPLAWRLPFGMAGVLLLPFLFGEPTYAWAQYRQALGKLNVAGVGLEGFCDVGALLRTLGVRTPDGILMGVRAAAAPATLALAWFGLRRWGPPRGDILVLGLAACYLMLFNPRTEANSYLILAPIVGTVAAWRLLVDGRTGEGWVLAAIALGLASDHYGTTIHLWTDHWFKATLTTFFLAYLAYLALVHPPPAMPLRDEAVPLPAN